MLAVVLTLGAMPVYGTFASAGTDEPTAETASETPAPSVEPDTSEPAAAPAPQGEPEETPTPSSEVTPNGEPEASPTPGETPTESPEPSESAPATYENSISGTLWLDMFDDIGNSIYAGDGIRQSEELSLAGYTVELFKSDDKSNAVATTTTDSSGKYKFENIEPGSYVAGIKTTTMDGVEYLLPLFWLDGTTGDNRFVATYDEVADAYLYAYTAPVTVAEDSEIVGMDAGMRTIPEAQLMAATIIDMSTVSASGTGYTYASNVVTITTSGEYEIIGTTTTKRVVVASGVTADITLNGVSITNSSVSPFQLEASAEVNLTIAGTNTLKCSWATVSTYGIRSGIYVPTDTKITIGGTGSLEAIGGYYGAGIGGSGVAQASSPPVVICSSGTIIINSGTITATSTHSAAGIGGGFQGRGGTIIITGGTVNATVTGFYGAGIGGGSAGAGGAFGSDAITITGGNVIAKSYAHSPAIGGGNGSIKITGGTVQADSCTSGTGLGSPGIGGNCGIAANTNFGTIDIEGGTVIATAGSATTTAPGIGGGSYATGGTVTISGGQVTAKGNSTTSPGIGAYSKTASSNLPTVVFTGGSIYPIDSAGTVSVFPAPTNGDANGNDPVGLLTFTEFAGQNFTINTAGSAGPYTYKGVGHAAAAYPWLVYPGIITDPASNVTANSATLNGTYYMNGTTISSAYFEYGTSTGYGNTKTLTTPTNTTSGNIESVSDNLTGLTSNTTYHYRLVITVGSITVPGNDMTFTTKPVVDTLTAAPTGSSTATISGTIAAGSENISDVIITYATDAGFTANVVTLDGSSGVTFTDTTYTANITGLTSGQTYYVKVEAVGPGGTSDAKTGSFLAGGYPVTEKFVGLNGSAVDATGLPDNTVFVTGSYTASGIPTSHTAGGNTYTYIGYKLDSYTTGDALTSGTPSSVTITGNRDVYYVYAIAEGSIKIEKYAHDGTTLLPGAEFQLEKLTGPGGTIDTTFTAQTLTTGAGGSVTFANLSAGSYRITETKAPTGYELLTAAFEVDIPKDITYAVGTPPADSSYLYSTTSGSNVIYHYYDVTYKVSDQASIAMPSAGATNTFPPYALWGGSIILLAALSGGILWLKRRRAYAPKHG